MGLIDRLAPDAAALDAEATAFAARIAAASPWSIRAQKEVFGLLRGGADDHARSRELFGASFVGDDHREGFAAFMEKRPPRF